MTKPSTAPLATTAPLTGDMSDRHDTTVQLWSRFQLTVLHARFQATTAAELPAYTGSTLRGAFGHSLKALACHRRDGHICDRCNSPSKCAYGELFEGSSSSTANSGVLPYIIQPPVSSREHYQEGDTFETTFILVGESRAWLPWVIWSLGRMGWQGLGGGREQWHLIDVLAEGPDRSQTSLLDSFDHSPCVTAAQLLEPLPEFNRCRIEFVTPTSLSIKENGENRKARRIDGPLLIRRLLRRVGDLGERYCGWQPGPDFYRQFSLQAADIHTDAHQLHKEWWERYSTRQHAKHGLSGLVGTLELSSIPLSLRPLLILGTYVNVGKSAGFGMGCYRLTLLG